MRKDALCGPYIDSTFKRLVGGDLHGSVLTCFSFNPDNQTVNTADVTDKSSVFAGNLEKLVLEIASSSDKKRSMISSFV